jgi:hypothetical protein
VKKQRWRKTKPKMKLWNCDFCGKSIKVLASYEPKYCCSGYECGCYGLPINEMLCDECLEKHFSKPIK